MVNRPANSKFLDRDFSIKGFFKNCHKKMISRASKTPFPSILNTLLLDFIQQYNRVSKWKWEGKKKQINLKCFVITHNQFHNILRLFDVLPNFSLTTSETVGDYYLPTWYIPVASRVVVPSKIDAYPSEEEPFSLEDFPPIFLNDYSKNYFW